MGTPDRKEQEERGGGRIGGEKRRHGDFDARRRRRDSFPRPERVRIPKRNSTTIPSFALEQFINQKQERVIRVNEQIIEDGKAWQIPPSQPSWSCCRRWLERPGRDRERGEFGRPRNELGKRGEGGMRVRVCEGRGGGEFFPLRRT